MKKDANGGTPAKKNEIKRTSNPGEMVDRPAPPSSGRPAKRTAEDGQLEKSRTLTTRQQNKKGKAHDGITVVTYQTNNTPRYVYKNINNIKEN